MFDIKAGQVVISRDVNFDESSFAFSMEPSIEEVDNATLDLELLDINDNDVRQTNYKQTGKQKPRPNNNNLRPFLRHTSIGVGKCVGQLIRSRP